VQFAHRNIHGPTGHHRPGKSPVLPLHPATQLPTPTIPLPGGCTGALWAYSLHPVIDQSPIFFFRSDQFTAGHHLREDQRTSATAQVPVPGGSGLATRFGHSGVGNRQAGATLGGAITRSGYDVYGFRIGVTVGTHLSGPTPLSCVYPVAAAGDEPHEDRAAGTSSVRYCVPVGFSTGPSF